MNGLKDNPLALLLSTGLLLGLYFPVGKLASAAGINPFLWALNIAFLPGLILTAVSARSGGNWTGHWGFAIGSSLLAFVIPNGIIFAALPHIGSGFVALTFACSPIVTAALSMATGVRPPNAKVLAGVGLGFAGAVLVAWSRSAGGWTAEAIWVLVAFLVPISLGCGNVFRTARWPEGMSPLRMAAQTNLAAAVPFVALLLATAGTAPFTAVAAHPGLLLLQVLISTAMFALFFRLQWVGGPTYLSQIGYVAAAVGLGAGVLFLGETYPALVWLGAALIAAGVAVSNWPSRA